MSSNFVKTNGIQLNVLEAGEQNAPLLILLHGFPEFSFGWRKQLLPLASAGYRVLAPDQRGYNLSDKPTSISAYTLDQLAADVIGLMDEVGANQARLVGHDWGGAVAWHAAQVYPERVSHLITINAPHLSVMREQLMGSFSQLLKSWHMLFFQLPWIPEQVAKAGNWRIPIQSLVDTSQPGTFGKDELKRYQEAWSRPHAYRSMINWYRAMFRQPTDSSDDDLIRVPTLMIWGLKDQFLKPDLAEASIAFCEDGRVQYVDEGTHWVHLEEPEVVNELIKAFLAAKS